MGEINAAFPDTLILARQGVIDGIPERPAKRLRRQEAYGDQIPDETPVPQPLTRDSCSLEGHIVDFVDLRWPRPRMPPPSTRPTHRQ